MALNTLPAGAFADDAITADKINLANTFAFTGTVTGASKFVNSSRVLYTAGTVTITSTGSSADTGIDHTYTASSTSNKLLHLINDAWRQVPDGGTPGGVTIYADDVAITEINSQIGLGEWHQDGGTTQMTGSSVHYFSSSVASTSAIKYSIYARGQDFRIQNGSGFPLIWTILEIAP